MTGGEVQVIATVPILSHLLIGVNFYQGKNRVVEQRNRYHGTQVLAQ